jgi:poly(hydroxyalkanoate) depolymerase family esterase
MFKYVPKDLEASRPLVVALHGCLQNAAGYDDETGWTEFADKHRFALLLPEQSVLNNPARCFNWFNPQDFQRGQGEAMSIRQMIDKMQLDHQSDPARIYVSGLSSGGAMTAVMLATYPELFSGGAIIAGIPYGCASSVREATTQCGLSARADSVTPIKSLSPNQWGDLVRGATTYSGVYPPVAIWQGSADHIVNPLNATELMKQWTNVLGIDQIADGQTVVSGRVRKEYRDRSGRLMLETYMISGMPHGTPIDPGEQAMQCGDIAPYVVDADICSSFHIVRFWGLDQL